MFWCLGFLVPVILSEAAVGPLFLMNVLLAGRREGGREGSWDKRDGGRTSPTVSFLPFLSGALSCWLMFCLEPLPGSRCANAQSFLEKARGRATLQKDEKKKPKATNKLSVEGRRRLVLTLALRRLSLCGNAEKRNLASSFLWWYLCFKSVRFFHFACHRSRRSVCARTHN